MSEKLVDGERESGPNEREDSLDWIHSNKSGRCDPELIFKTSPAVVCMCEKVYVFRETGGSRS